jgi:hypothetical protein
MYVPETAMYKDDRVISGLIQHRVCRIYFGVKKIPEALYMVEAVYQQFCLYIATADVAHVIDSD